MEDLSLIVNDSNVTANIPPLPVVAVALAPLLFLGLVAALVSNAILLVLVVLTCVHKFNNNINIYLFSLAIGGLIGAFEVFCLLTVVVARRWVLGTVICSINWYATVLYNFLFFAIYVVISRDKLKIVKDPFRGRTTNKRAYIHSVASWTVSIISSFLVTGWVFPTIPDGLTRGNFVCFGIMSRRISSRFYFVVTSFVVVTFWVVTTVAILITLANFIRILVELRKLKRLRQRFVQQSHRGMIVKVNGQDKPLYCTGEERTAKSLTLVYFIQFICIFTSYSMSYAQIIRNFVLPAEIEDGPNFQFYFIVQLMILFFPCVNPVFLIATNRRLRGRVKELYKCSLNPENEASPMHQLATAMSTLSASNGTSVLIGGNRAPPSRRKTMLNVFNGVGNKTAPAIVRA